jgi:hypothetical protein
MGGVALFAVQKARRTGRIPALLDGTIDPCSVPYAARHRPREVRAHESRRQHKARRQCILAMHSV